MKIPIIDISPIFTNDKVLITKLVNEVKLTMESVGFFMIKGHQFSPTIMNSLWKNTRNFFNQPIEIKSLIKMTSSYPYGYEASEILSQTFNNETRKYPDMKETFQVCLNYPENKLPTIPQGIDISITNYYNQMSILASKILEIFALALELPRDWFINKINNHQSALRMLNYPHVSDYEINKIRCSPHSDYGIITILKQDNTGGLQVLSSNNQWIDATPEKDCFVINIGDLFKRWTNDKWNSTVHRVVNPEIKENLNNRRQSIAFFFNANPDCLVSTFDSCKINGISKYEDILAGDYLLNKHNASKIKN
jgi:isopenicillin N synthase-like dioxygenase